MKFNSKRISSNIHWNDYNYPEIRLRKQVELYVDVQGLKKLVVLCAKQHIIFFWNALHYEYEECIDRTQSHHVTSHRNISIFAIKCE